MDKKQTAVQNLIIELEQFAKFPMVDKPTIEAAIEFAKLRLELEKKQMIDAVLDDVADNENMKKKFVDRFEQYYNETYGN